MANSLPASKSGLEIVDQARKRKGWNKDSPIWIDAANKLLQATPKGSVSRSTLQRFWGKQAIRQENFKAICKAVGVENWEAIVDNSPTLAPYMEFVAYDDAWVGRETLIQQLSDRVQSSCRVLLLIGITGIGKTALAERVVEELRGHWREHRDKFEDENKTSDFASVALQWLEKWGEPVPKEERKPEHLLRRLVKRLRENRYLILMDSLEYLLTGNADDGWGDFKDEWWGKFFVSFLAESDCQSRFILTSQDLPTKFETAECDRYKNLWYCQLLKGLEIPEQVELFQKAELDGDLELPHSPLRVIGEVYDGHKAVELYQQSLTLSRKLKNRLLESATLGNIGATYHSLGDYKKSIEYQHQRLEIVRVIQDKQGEQAVLGNLGNDYLRLGNYKKAVDCYEQVLNITREIQNRNGEGMALSNLGYAYHCLGEYHKAIDYYKQSLAIKREIGDRSGEGNALCNLGTTLMQIGQYSEAKEALQASEDICRQIGYRYTESESLLRLAELHHKFGDRTLALEYCDHALSIATELGIPLAKECQELKEKLLNESV